MPLVFPGSGRRKSDEPPDPNQFSFRDGKRVLPPHLAAMMSGIDTARYRYDEAVDLANKNALRDHINTAYDTFVAGHFREGRR